MRNCHSKSATGEDLRVYVVGVATINAAKTFPMAQPFGYMYVYKQILVLERVDIENLKIFTSGPQLPKRHEG